MSEVRNGLRHFERAQVCVGKRIRVWFALQGYADGVVSDLIRDEDGTLCVSIEPAQAEIRPERLPARVHEGVAKAP